MLLLQIPLSRRLTQFGGRGRVLRHQSSLTQSLPSSKFGIGSNTWSRLRQTPDTYNEIIQYAVQNGVTNFEAGSTDDGGDVGFVQALQQALSATKQRKNTNGNTAPIHVFSRVGYRTIQGQSTQQLDILQQDGDVVIEEHEPPSTADQSGSSSNNTFMARVVHNMTPSYLQSVQQMSPLTKFQNNITDHNVNVTFMIQNPETQVFSLMPEHNGTPTMDASDIPPLQERQEHLQQVLIEALSNTPQDSSFGIVTNGIGLPSDHPLHLSADTLRVVLQECKDNVACIQVPANVMETNGLEAIAKLQKEDDIHLPPIMVMRPLTYYPDLGAGVKFPYQLTDFPIPSGVNDASSKKSIIYTNELTASALPSSYSMAYQEVMAHLDATELLKAKQERDLTPEERETLDGCKLLQSMIHDLDSALHNNGGQNPLYNKRQWDVQLSQQIVPLLMDTVEELDASTARVLENYFAAYAIAVRCVIANQTRQLIIEKYDNKDAKGRNDDDDDDNIDKKNRENNDESENSSVIIPSEMTLQEYSLRHVFEKDIVSQCMVGVSSVEELIHVLDMINNIKK